MSEEKTPFERAQDNINKFTESAELLYNLYELQKLLSTTKTLSAEEQEGVNQIVDLAIENLSQYLSKKGGKWN